MLCRNSPIRIAHGALSVLAALGALACTSAGAAPQAASAGNGPQTAVWTTRELEFVYQGFTAQYSCDGLSDRLRVVLTKLGASNLHLQEGPCSSLGAPDPFPGVKIKMDVLEPAGDRRAAGATPTVPAHWQTVDLVSRTDSGMTAGDCELIEQIHRRILPLFAARNVQYEATCVPRQSSVGGVRLRAEVLVADVTAAASVGR